MMATISKNTSKNSKSTKTPKSAKPKPDATSTDRLRKSVLKEITDRIAKGEKPETNASASLHEGTITRGDGEVVKVSVPADHSEQGAPTETSPTAPKPTKPKKPKAEKAPKPAKAPKPKRVSALDAAATVLADTKKPMRAIDLIAEIQQRGLWQSPKGKTPEASLYAAMIREISAKGRDSRFAKHERGLFIAQVPTNAPASA